MRSDRPGGRAGGWLELIRPPNLFTVPGDPLAGFLLAGGEAWGAAALAALAACLLYMAGLIWNDCADVEEDRATRPERPIPSGRVRRTHALVAATLLALAGVAAARGASQAAGWAALVLLGLILLYDFLARRRVAAGIVVMGLCRGGSVLLGAAAAMRPDVRVPAAALPWTAAAGVALTVAAISLLAHGETRRQRLGVKPWLPAAAVALLFGAVGRTSVPSAICAALALGALLRVGFALRGSPAPALVQRSIGAMIRVLLPVQAGLCALTPDAGLLPAALLLAAWPVAGRAGRAFHGS